MLPQKIFAESFLHSCKLQKEFGIKIACMQVTEEELKKLGQRIKELREAKKLSLSALAYRNSIEISTLSRIEKGVVDPKYSSLLGIAKALDLELYELLNFDTLTKG